MKYPVRTFALSRCSHRASLLALTALTAGPLHANELYGPWYWHGFASQAAIHTSDNHFFGDSDDGLSTDFRELGLIIAGDPTRDLHIAGQLLHLKAGEVNYDVRVDYAFASYTLYSGLEGSFGVKAGRLRTPYGFFNETRDVAHTRSSIMLPQSIYHDGFRDFLFARDGVQAFGSYQQGRGTFYWDLAFSRPSISKQQAVEYLNSPIEPSGSVEGRVTPVARVLWDWDMGTLRLGGTYQMPELDYRPEAGDFFNPSTLKARSLILSAEYNTPSWSLISEYGSLNVRLHDFFPGINIERNFEGFYVQGVYRFLSNWDSFLRWDHHRIDATEWPKADTYTKDLTLGLGWRPRDNWLVRGEWHAIDGNSWLSLSENPKDRRSSRWHMVLFQISYYY